jgi:ligand-binding sensor domain-containing protein/signal transduction histidine kinase
MLYRLPSLNPSHVRSFSRTILFIICKLIFTVSTLLALDHTKDLTQYGHQMWQTENGLPQNTVRQILQTKDGYIWIATEDGLARFDGLEFKTFDKNNTPELKDNYIRLLFEDTQGALWIGTPSGLTRLKNRQFLSYTIHNGLPDNDVSVLYEDKKGRLWIGTSNGLAQFNENQTNKFTIQNGLLSNNITNIIEDKNGNLWIGTTEGLNCLKENGQISSFTDKDGLSNSRIRLVYEDSNHNLWIVTNYGLNRLKDGYITSYSIKQGLSSNNIDTLFEDQQKNLWIGTPNGLNLFKDEKFTVFTTQNGLSNNRIGSIYQDRSGNLWIATAGGLNRFKDNYFDSFTTKEGLSYNIVLTVFEDREGNLWIGTEAGGLNLLKDNKFTSYSVKEGLSNDLIKSIYQDRSGQIWIGTHGGGLNLLKDGKFTIYTTKDGLSSDVILAIGEDKSGNLWVGTPDGLNQFKNGKFTTYTTADGLSHDFIRSIYTDRSGTLWIGTRSGLNSYKDNAFTSYTTADGLSNDFIGVIHEDKQGALWIGTLNGLNRLKDGQFKSYTIKDGLSHNVVISLHEDGNGMLWIGTNGGGLNRFKDEKFTSYTTKNGLFDDLAYRILEDENQNLWISCNKGIFRVNKNELNSFSDGKINRINSIIYGTADGMKTRECNGGGHPAGWKTKDGRLWFPTIKGISMIDPQNIKENQVPPSLVIEEIVVNNQSLKVHQDAKLPSDTNRLEFHYVGLSFRAPENIKYKYKLEGFDKDWVEAENRRVAYYTSIPPGNYRFQVIASNNDGVWNLSGASIDFELKPRIYQAYWFYALCLMAIGLAGWGLYRLRVKHLEAKFEAVLAERNRMAREIHDTLAQGFAGISVQLEVVAKMMFAMPESAKEHLDQARILVRNSLAEARRSVWALRSSALEDGSLVDALSNIARQLSSETTVQLEVSGTPRKLSYETENHLLRIGQEAVTNAIKHAQASRVNIKLNYNQHFVMLTIQDDGCGFDVQASKEAGKRGHFGLVNMQERVAHLKGSLAVNSSLGHGTEIIVQAPIDGN